MFRTVLGSLVLSLALAGASALAQDKPAPAAKPPLYATTKVDGTDGVYVFRYGNHQAMFVVTSAGVVATDPIGYGRPEAVTTYIDEIRETFDQTRTIELGGTRLELSYHGLNHSDSTIVMRLPKERIVFIVDTIPVGAMPGRGMIDFYPLETEAFMEEVLKMDWERLIPGHPGQPGGRLGTKADVADQLAFLRYASAEVKEAARQGKCWDAAEKEVKLDKYEKMPGYANNLQFVVRRYCGLWGRGT